MEQILTISIPTYSKRTKIKPHIVYHISITAPVRSWTVQRRYSDFFELNQKFIESNLTPPVHIPPKSSIFSLTSFDNPQFLETRRKGLEEYLQAILSVKDDRFRKLMEWKAFLGISHLKSRNAFQIDESENISTSSLNSNSNSYSSSQIESSDLVSTSSSSMATTKLNLKSSEKWLEESRDLNVIINEIRTCIAAKNKFISRNETAAALEATMLARKNLNILTVKYQKLERELNRQLEEYYSQDADTQIFKKRSRLLSKNELYRRRDLLENIHTEKEQLEKLLGNMSNINDIKSNGNSNSSGSSSFSSTTATNSSVYYTSKGNSGGKISNSNNSQSSLNTISNQEVQSHKNSQSTTTYNKSKRKFGVTISKEVEEKTRGMDNSQILQLQKNMLDNQDVALDQFTTILKRQKEIGNAINQELDLQNQLLENLDSDVNKVNLGLNQAEKRMKKVLGDKKK